MTIKEWVYKHVNVTFVLLTLTYFLFLAVFAYSLDVGNWIASIASLAGAIYMLGAMTNWWRNQL